MANRFYKTVRVGLSVSLLFFLGQHLHLRHVDFDVVVEKTTSSPRSDVPYDVISGQNSRQLILKQFSSAFECISIEALKVTFCLFWEKRK